MGFAKPVFTRWCTREREYQCRDKNFVDRDYYSGTHFRVADLLVLAKRERNLNRIYAGCIDLM
ncbi:MAG: hypothetical protein JWP78_3516 [Mucilaginibacter sp.]|nr:hypothetical protein [Mucilaginibacter sp.]